MVIVADTSPLNYLILIDAVGVVPLLYGPVRTPPSCIAELAAPGAPETVRRWAGAPPAWLLVSDPGPISDKRLDHLDVGERDALSLALQLHADLVLMDERTGRATAQACGLRVAGTIRVLLDADKAGLLVLAEAFARLRATTFRANPALLEMLLRHRGNA